MDPIPAISAPLTVDSPKASEKRQIEYKYLLKTNEFTDTPVQRIRNKTVRDIRLARKAIADAVTRQRSVATKEMVAKERMKMKIAREEYTKLLDMEFASRGGMLTHDAKCAIIPFTSPPVELSGMDYSVKFKGFIFIPLNGTHRYDARTTFAGYASPSFLGGPIPTSDIATYDASGMRMKAVHFYVSNAGGNVSSRSYVENQIIPLDPTEQDAEKWVFPQGPPDQVNWDFHDPRIQGLPISAASQICLGDAANEYTNSSNIINQILILERVLSAEPQLGPYLSTERLLGIHSCMRCKALFQLEFGKDYKRGYLHCNRPVVALFPDFIEGWIKKYPSCRPQASQAFEPAFTIDPVDEDETEDIQPGITPDRSICSHCNEIYVSADQPINAIVHPSILRRSPLAAQLCINCFSVMSDTCCNCRQSYRKDNLRTVAPSIIGESSKMCLPCINHRLNYQENRVHDTTDYLFEFDHLESCRYCHGTLLRTRTPRDLAYENGHSTLFYGGVAVDNDNTIRFNNINAVTENGYRYCSQACARLKVNMLITRNL